MVIGILLITFRIHDCHSLKGKRKIVKAIISRIRNTYNASVAEVGSNDLYQKSEIGISITGNDRRVINSILDKIIDFADDLHLAEMIDSEIEIINF